MQSHRASGGAVLSFCVKHLSVDLCISSLFGGVNAFLIIDLMIGLNTSRSELLAGDRKPPMAFCRPAGLWLVYKRSQWSAPQVLWLMTILSLLTVGEFYMTS